MKITSLAVVLGVGLGAAFWLACSGGETSPDPAATATAPSPLVASLAGTYDFVLTESDVARELRAKCESKAHGDAKAAADCFAEVEREAASEKIRFSQNTKGELVFTSFGVEDGKEDIFLEVPLAAVEAQPNVIVGKPTALPKGSLLQGLKHARTEIRIERMPNGGVTMIDAEKGKLVYRKAK